MGKRGLGKGLGALFGEEVTKDETPVVKRAPKNTAKKDAEIEKKEQNQKKEQKSGEDSSVKAVKRSGSSNTKKEKGNSYNRISNLLFFSCFSKIL